jgi:DNA-directed RNA polymerase beta' subunit
MALINCLECRKEISDKASACPHCGAPVDNQIIERKKLEQKQQAEIEEQEEREERERLKRVKVELNGTK